MNGKRWNLACALGLVLATMLACSFSFTTANLSSLKVSKSKSASTTDSSFGPKDLIYVVADVSNSPGKIKLKGRLLADSIEGYTSGTVLPGAETTIDMPGSGTGTFTFTPNAGGWPNGSYKVEVSMLTENGEQKDQKSATFSVSGNSAAKTTSPDSNATQEPAGTEKETAPSSDQ